MNKIFTNSMGIIKANAKKTAPNQPDFFGYTQGKKKDGTPFEIKVMALWRKPDGTIGFSMIDNNTNAQTGVTYSGYVICKKMDIETVNTELAKQQPQAQDESYNNMDFVQSMQM